MRAAEEGSGADADEDEDDEAVLDSDREYPAELELEAVLLKVPWEMSCRVEASLSLRRVATGQREREKQDM